MTSTSLTRQPGRATEVLACVKFISNIYRALTGREPRRTGPAAWRTPAVWRGGDVSMDDVREGTVA